MNPDISSLPGAFISLPSRISYQRLGIRGPGSQLLTNIGRMEKKMEATI